MKIRYNLIDTTGHVFASFEGKIAVIANVALIKWFADHGYSYNKTSSRRYIVHNDYWNIDTTEQFELVRA